MMVPHMGRTASSPAPQNNDPPRARRLPHVSSHAHLRQDPPHHSGRSKSALHPKPCFCSPSHRPGPPRTEPPKDPPGPLPAAPSLPRNLLKQVLFLLICSVVTSWIFSVTCWVTFEKTSLYSGVKLVFRRTSCSTTILPALRREKDVREQPSRS